MSSAPKTIHFYAVETTAHGLEVVHRFTSDHTRQLVLFKSGHAAVPVTSQHPAVRRQFDAVRRGLPADFAFQNHK